MAGRIVLIVPIPLKDRHGRPVARGRRRAVLNRLLLKLGALFGSATGLPSWGSWKKDARTPVSLDRGQTVVLVLTTPGKLRRGRSRLTALLRAAGRELDQDQMAAIAFASARGTLLVRCG